MIRDHVSGTLSAIDRAIVDSVPPGGNWRSIPESIPSARLAQIRASAARGTGSRSTYYGRLRWTRPSYTISTYFSRPGNGAFIHPAFGRLISIREAARLQSFPDDFIFCGPLRSRFAQVGNAVPPLLAWHVASLVPAGNVVDLFAGAGGFGLGFAWAGHRIVGCADIDAWAVKTIAANTDDHGPIDTVDLSDFAALQRFVARVRDKVGDGGVDTVIGGPPCQGFSTAGSNLLSDPRNRLVHGFLAGVKLLGPARVFMENVPALAHRKHRTVLDDLRQEFSSLGYDTDVAILHAEGYGVPQLRRRLVLQAVRRGIQLSWPAAPCQIMPPSQLRLQPASKHMGGRQPSSVADAIADLPSATANSPDEPVPYANAATTPYQRWARGELPLKDMLPPPEQVDAVEAQLQGPWA